MSDISATVTSELSTADNEPSTMDKHFQTAHLDESVERRSVPGGILLLGNHLVRFVIQTSGTMVLARLLSPEDFGLVAMVQCIVGLISVLSDCGLSVATYQSERITHEQTSSLFWINVCVGAVLSVLLCLASPILAWMYSEQRVLLITVALSSSFIWSGLTAQHYAVLVRQMQFWKMMMVQTLPVLLANVVGVRMAMAGWEYWSLVGLFLTQGVSTAVIAWLCSAWRPSWFNRRNNVRDLLAFGSQLAAYDVLTYVIRNADNFMIGWFLGPQSLGMYSKAYALLMVPTAQISGPLSGVILPALSRLQTQPDRFRDYFLKAIAMVSFVTMPMTVFACVDAGPIVRVLLGSQWTDAATIFRVLTPAALVCTLYEAPVWLLTSLGKPRTQLRWACLSAPVILSGFGIGLMWGTIGVAASFSITFGFCFVMFTVTACRESPVRFSELVAAVIPSLVASLVAAMIVWTCHSTEIASPLLALLLDAAVFSVTYLPLYCLSPQGRAGSMAVVSRFARWSGVSAST